MKAAIQIGWQPSSGINLFISREKLLFTIHIKDLHKNPFLSQQMFEK
jgi:hypothetical protein